MKRQQDRDLSPKNKRSRGAYIDHEDRGRDVYGLENERREGRGRDRGGQAQGRDTRGDRDRDFDSGYNSRTQRRYRDSLDRGSDRTNDSYRDNGRDDGRDRFSHQQVQPPTDYRTLCISNLNPDVPDSHVVSILNKEFRNFGDFNIKVVHQGDFRIAYVNFRYPEDAHAAKEAFPSMTLFDMVVRIDPVYQTYSKRQRSRSPVDSSIRQKDAYHSRDLDMSSIERRGGRRDQRDVPQRGDRYQDDGRQQQSRDSREPKEHKFPHHLDHIEPEYDDKATRTLFVGSLDHEVTDAELRQVFERYGTVEDVDIKRKSQGNPYAFVRFLNLDMAHRAKVDMSGHYIGNSQCKIGYGKVNPTCCLWVGGLGPGVIPEEMIRLFDRFGPIERMEWPARKKFAYILYDDVEAAKAASNEMRGYPLGGPDRRLRVDFADPAHMDMPFDDRSEYARVPSYEEPVPSRRRDSVQDQYRGYSNSRSSDSRNDWVQQDRSESYRNNERTREQNYGGRYGSRYDEPEQDRRPRRNSFEDDRDRAYRIQTRQDRTPPARDRNHDRGYSPAPRRRDRSPIRSDRVGDTYNGRDARDGDRRDRPLRKEGDRLPMGNVEQVETISDLATCLPVVWSGALVLKNSAFTTKMHLLSGDVHLVDTLMRDPSTTESPMLRITQRLRLDQPKLEEVHRRVSQSGGHSVLLAMPGAAYDDPNSAVQQRPLKNLVTYLKQKVAAGVITLPPYTSSDRDNIGVLHAFPTCQFSQDFLSEKAPRLNWDKCTEDFLVIVVVRGSAISA